MPDHPWERQPGESPQAYDAFECYRRLPAGDRSLQRAWEDHCNQPGQASQRRGREPGRPHGHWTRWMSRWRWKERALAWDQGLAALARDQELDRELKARLAAQEEDLRERGLMRQEPRIARAAGRRILLRVLKQVEGGELDQLSLPELLPHLAKAATLLEVGQRLDRLLAGEPTEITRTETGNQAKADRLVAIIRRFVPEDHWQELSHELGNLEAEQATQSVCAGGPRTGG